MNASISSSGTVASAITAIRPATGTKSFFRARIRRRTPEAGASRGLRILSVSTSTSSTPDSTLIPSWAIQSPILPSAMERPHFGIVRG